jgi:coenzyme F420 biosynthesis associated uncharacterized protein
MGLIVGAAAALAGRYLSHRAERAAREGLVDWDQAAAAARARFRRMPGALSPAELARSEAAYAAIMDRIVPLLEQRLGAPLPGVVERHAVVDRAGWADANLATFRTLVARLEERFARTLLPRDGSIGASLTVLTNRFVTTRQVGFLLGFLGTRVLGQYDVALLSAEARPGRLLFVEENIRQTATALGVPLEDFRVWIALHETTHAYEFEAHPWLRPYLADRLERQLATLLEDATALESEGVRGLARRWRSGSGQMLPGFLSPEQRTLLRETQLVMSVLEGFSDWVMDEVGAGVLPDVHDLRARFEARRKQRKRGLEAVVARLTGLDMKLEQYRRGERFVAGVAAAGGRGAVGHLFDGPWTLPTEREMEHPREWVRRVAPQTLLPDDAGGRR